MDIVKTVAKCIIISIVLILVGLAIMPAYKQIDSDYVKTIEVDKSEKIIQTLENAINDVKSRNFIVVGIHVKECTLDNTFLVTVEGVDEGALLKLGK